MRHIRLVELRVAERLDQLPWLRVSAGKDVNLVTLADSARDAKEWTKAAELYRRYLRGHPDAFPIWVQLGHALKESGRPAEALAAYGRAQAINPDDPDLLLNLGHTHKRMGHRESAIGNYRRSFLADGNPHAKSELLALGQSLSYSAVPAQADEVKTARTHPAARLWRLARPLVRWRLVRKADAARDRRDWEAAAISYADYLRWAPDAFPIWVQLGHALKESGKLDSAMEAYKKALSLKANDGDLLLNLGHTYKLAGDFGEALELYRKSSNLGTADGAHELRSLERSLDPGLPPAVAAPLAEPVISHLEPEPVFGPFIGVLEGHRGAEYWGWAVRVEDTASQTEVEFLYDGKVIHTAPCDITRDDILEYGAGGGFRTVLPPFPADGGKLHLRVKGTHHALLHAPVTLKSMVGESHPGHGEYRRLDPYEAWRSFNSFTTADRVYLKSRLSSHKDSAPKISIITPAYNTPLSLLSALADSIVDQVYMNWEWCIYDDASPDSNVRTSLQELATFDPRIRVVFGERNGGISVATNTAVEHASGDVLVFVDHDDLLTPNCLAEIALYYAENPIADIVYSDDDKMDMDDCRYAPQFKPDWSPVLLLSFMYMSHAFSVRRGLFVELGGFRPALDGSQDYDFALRAAERAKHVGHIPKILYHWRAAPGSTATGGDAKPASLAAGLRAVREALERRKIRGRAVWPDWAERGRVGMYAIEFEDDGPSVTIIIPTRNNLYYVKRCIESLKKTTYRNYGVLVIDNDSDDPATVEFLNDVASWGVPASVRHIPSVNGKFSFAHLMNCAAKGVSSEFLLFLNNDTEVISPNWLSQMMGYAQMPGVGAVGARLLYDDGTVQHAGIVHGYHEGLVGHAFRGAPSHDWGYLGFMRVAREYSGVTAACMLTPRSAFERLGGFDEQNFAVAYNDVDYCYRLVSQGQTCVYCPEATLFHFEGKSRGFADNPKEVLNFRRMYGSWRDAWYNPNLSLENEHFVPSSDRPPTLTAGPVRAIFVSHNLNQEGAPAVLFDIVVGLANRGVISPKVISPVDGVLRQKYEAAGVQVELVDLSEAGSVAGFSTALRSQRRDFRPDVLVANTLETYWAVAGATILGLPTIWCQHESEPWETYYDRLPKELRTAAYGAFAQAYKVLYVSEATRRAWRPVETRGNFRVIRYGIPSDRLEEEVGRWSRARARARLNVSADELSIAVVGTVCSRKGQADLVSAYAALPKEVQERIRIFVVGHSGEPDYARSLRETIDALPPECAGRILLTGHADDPFIYYRAADLLVCTSRVESAPRVLLEGMACDLPIITTPVFGIPELVKPDVNAFFYDPGNIGQLRDQLVRFASDRPLLARMAANSRGVLECVMDYDRMLDEYAVTIQRAVGYDPEPWSSLEWSRRHLGVSA